MQDFLESSTGLLVELKASTIGDAVVSYIHGIEALSELFEYRVTFASANRALDPESILGTIATLHFTSEKNSRFINGVITQFSQGTTALKDDIYVTEYSITIRPKLWLLTLDKNCKIFQNKSAMDIIKSVLSDSGVRDISDKTSSCGKGQREYCVQYNESSFNFISRLMEDEGIFYYFTHESSKHTLVLVDSSMKYEKISEKAQFIKAYNKALPLGKVFNTSLDSTMHSGGYALADYNYEISQTRLFSTLDSKWKGSKVYEYPGGFEKTGEGENLSKMRIQEIECVHLMLRGDSTIPSFTPGYSFSLTEHHADNFNKTYVLCRVEHTFQSAENGSFVYRNHFSAFPDGTEFRAPRKTPKPRVFGNQTAVVVCPSGKEIYRNEYCAVKVHFHWDLDGKTKDTDDSSCWIRVAQLMSGSGWGGIFVPRVGQEVVVSFLEGNPDRPLIVGCVYNDQYQPTYPDTDDKKTTFFSASYEDPSRFNEIRFDDTKDKEEIYVHAQKDINVDVDDSSVTTILHAKKGGPGNHSLTLKKGNMTTLLNKGNKTITLEKGNMTVKVNGNYTLDVSGNITIKAGKNIKIEAGQTIVTNSTMDTTINSGMNLKALAMMNFMAQANVSLTAVGMASAILGSPSSATVMSPGAAILMGGGAALLAGVAGPPPIVPPMMPPIPSVHVPSGGGDSGSGGASKAGVVGAGSGIEGSFDIGGSGGEGSGSGGSGGNGSGGGSGSTGTGGHNPGGNTHTVDGKSSSSEETSKDKSNENVNNSENSDENSRSSSNKGNYNSSGNVVTFGNGKNLSEDKGGPFEGDIYYRMDDQGTDTPDEDIYYRKIKDNNDEFDGDTYYKRDEHSEDIKNEDICYKRVSQGVEKFDNDTYYKRISQSYDKFDGGIYYKKCRHSDGGSDDGNIYHKVITHEGDVYYKKVNLGGAGGDTDKNKDSKAKTGGGDFFDGDIYLRVRGKNKIVGDIFYRRVNQNDISFDGDVYHKRGSRGGEYEDIRYRRISYIGDKSDDNVYYKRITNGDDDFDGGIYYKKCKQDTDFDDGNVYHKVITQSGDIYYERDSVKSKGPKLSGSNSHSGVIGSRFEGNSSDSQNSNSDSSEDGKNSDNSSNSDSENKNGSGSQNNNSSGSSDGKNSSNSSGSGSSNGSGSAGSNGGSGSGGSGSSGESSSSEKNKSEDSRKRNENYADDKEKEEKEEEQKEDNIDNNDTKTDGITIKSDKFIVMESKTYTTLDVGDYFTTNVKNDITTNTNANLKSTSKSNMNLESQANMNLASKSNMSLDSSSNMNLASKANMSAEAKANMNLKSNVNMSLQSNVNMALKSNVSLTAEGMATAMLKSPASTKIQGAITQIGAVVKLG